MSSSLLDPKGIWNFLVPSEFIFSVQDWLAEEQRLCDMAKDTLRAFREKSVSRTNWKRVPANYQVGDHVVVQKNQFPQLQVGKFHAAQLGPYNITQVVPGSVVVRLSPTLGGQISVAHSFLRKFPLQLQDDEEWFLLDAEKESEV